jgi:hypothetical protein
VATLGLNDLDDVSTGGATNGQVLKWDSAAAEWNPGAGGGGGDLSDLSDVSIASPADGDVLRYDSSAADWKNDPGVTTGGSFVLTNQITNTTTSMADITGFSFPVEANKIYNFDFVLNVDTDASTKAIFWQFTGPASPTRFWANVFYFDSGPTYAWQVITAFSTPTSATTQASTQPYTRITGFLQNGANAGTVQLQWANEIASNTIYARAGSWGTWWEGGAWPMGVQIGAPKNAEYIVGAASAGLSAETVKPWLSDNYNLDDYPASPNSLDDEFEDSSLNVKWTKVNDPGTWTEGLFTGWAYVIATELGTDNFDNLIRLYQAAPAGAAAATYVAKVSLGVAGVAAEDAEFSGVGIYLGNSTDDELIGSHLQINNAASTSLPSQHRGIQATAGTLANVTTDYGYLVPHATSIYVKLEKTTTAAYTSANTYNMYFSLNGITWTQTGSMSKTFTHACDEVGIFVRRPKSQAGTPTVEAAIDFFRRTV